MGLTAQLLCKSSWWPISTHVAMYTARDTAYITLLSADCIFALNRFTISVGLCISFQLLWGCKLCLCMQWFRYLFINTLRQTEWAPIRQYYTRIRIISAVDSPRALTFFIGFCLWTAWRLFDPGGFDYHYHNQERGDRGLHYLLVSIGSFRQEYDCVLG